MVTAHIPLLVGFYLRMHRGFFVKSAEDREPVSSFTE